MSAAVDQAEERASAAARMGFLSGQVVQEIGHGGDVDEELREGIVSLTGKPLEGEELDDVADAVLLWFRLDDGDLTDALVDSLTYLEADGELWLCTPKPGRAGFVEAGDIGEAVATAGLSRTKAISIAGDWTGVRLSRARH
ncbi:DUF3052 domain-containing protein [Streptomyces goshikiensis]|uniref:DUF3052 domain-containing protein n=1 Tax=Streptomyces TaxID=1883 RepID=UPI000F54ED5A|nr:MULTISPECIES: DUF3052 domain-containing protein [Streptomyces]WBY23801.1 DUF3052 domain-containing protein [Streptomyces goshikiensis]WSS02709.1 DUF3052 domain-containing protein [Streptomyces goshikiensis]WSX96065.1 DUF3052 domain-containing protein [Streptomyces goshikiensis]